MFQDRSVGARMLPFLFLMKGKIQLSLIVGFVVSFSLHYATAAMVAFFPLRDEPMTPHVLGKLSPIDTHS